MNRDIPRIVEMLTSFFEIDTHVKGRVGLPTMTIRDHLKRRYRLMVLCAFAIPALGVLWLSYSTPINHTFRVDIITLVFIVNLALLLARFQCPSCHANITAVSRQVLFESGACTCPHCGIDLNKPLQAAKSSSKPSL
jgi:hypothetical protein